MKCREMNPGNINIVPPSTDYCQRLNEVPGNESRQYELLSLIEMFLHCLNEVPGNESRQLKSWNRSHNNTSCLNEVPGNESRQSA